MIRDVLEHPRCSLALASLGWLVTTYLLGLITVWADLRFSASPLVRELPAPWYHAVDVLYGSIVTLQEPFFSNCFVF